MKHIIKYVLSLCLLFSAWTLDISNKSRGPQTAFGPKNMVLPTLNWGKKNSWEKGLLKVRSRLFHYLKETNIEFQRAKAANDGTLGQGTYYPTNLVMMIKEMTAPLPDPTDCESASNQSAEENGGYAMIAQVNCYIGVEMGLTGVGVVAENLTSSDNGYFTARATANQSYGGYTYDYKVEVWADMTTKDGSNDIKFMNYWLDAGGKKGVMEMYPDIPGGTTTITMAMKVTWDATVSTAQTLSVTMQQNSSGTTWANRSFGMFMSGTLNESTGVMNFEAAHNGTVAQNSSMIIRLARDSNQTLAYGELRQADGTTVTGTGTYQCIDNSKSSSGSSSEYTVRDVDNSEANAVDEGFCTSLSLPAASTTPTEANLGLLTGNYTGTFSLDSTEAAPNP